MRAAEPIQDNLADTRVTGLIVADPAGPARA